MIERILVVHKSISPELSQVVTWVHLAVDGAEVRAHVEAVLDAAYGEWERATYGVWKRNGLIYEKCGLRGNNAAVEREGATKSVQKKSVCT